MQNDFKKNSFQFQKKLNFTKRKLVISKIDWIGWVSKQLKREWKVIKQCK